MYYNIFASHEDNGWKITAVKWRSNMFIIVHKGYRCDGYY